MKVLIVSPISASYPPRDGYSMFVFYTAYFLKELGNIESDIIVPENEKYPAKGIIDSGVFNNVFIYRMNSKWKSLFKSLFSTNIYTIIRHDINNEDLLNIINNINKIRYEAVIFNHSYSCYLYKKLLKHINIDNDRIFYWSINIDYIYIKRIANESNNLLRKYFHYINYKKLKRIELDYIRKFTRIFSVSKYETKILEEINPMASIHWIPIMLPEPKPIEIDKEYLLEIKKKVRSYKYKILFTGSLRISSNVYPVIWFANKIFPLIKSKLNACFIIVGKDPSKEIIDFVNKNKDILIFPNVPSITPFYEISDLVIVPLFNPAGVKLKLIEALKYKKKVVARPEALLGAGLENIVPSAMEPGQFAKKCIDALEGRINYEIVWKKFDEIYDNNKIINKLLSLIEK